MSRGLTDSAKSGEAVVRKLQAAARKRVGHKLFAKMSVAHVDDDEENVFFAEKIFSNGDFYTGEWVENMAHGEGKYFWIDGCMYVGEWSKGEPMGKGRFSWPSGATYQGDFKRGCMDGKGAYTGSSGEAFRGTWVMDLRHGEGTQSYSNGDLYAGDWRRGLQEGNGWYQWKKGIYYIGQWKNGMMNGIGTMVWKDGNRYDGTWENGFPKGTGTYRWEDGSFYVGVWSEDNKDQTGTYYPAENCNINFGSFDWDPQQVYSVGLRDCRIYPVELVPIFPSQKMPNWAEVDGKLLQKLPIRNNPSNGNDCKVSVGRSLGNCSLESDNDNLYRNPADRNDGDRQHQLRLLPLNKQGETISRGHKNYELMLSLQLGIRHSVGRPASSTSLDLRASAFDPKEKVWTKFPPEGSKYTPPHHSCEFKWKDFCPVVFRTLRKLFKVDPADYMLSICGNDALRELSSPGKSGSFFYLTHDDRYMIKTIKNTEVKVLLKMLPAYYKHVQANGNTLVTKFFGLHCLKLGVPQKKVRFVIMGNLFCSNYSIHRRFDLKGSTFGRTTDKPEVEIDATTTLKDLDLNYIFRLQRVWFQEFCRQVDRDCEFLEQEGVMDYSLLVGIHFREQSNLEALTPPHTPDVCTPTGNRDIENRALHFSRVEMDWLLSDPGRWPSIRLGTNMPARVERAMRRSNEIQLIGEPTGELYEVILFFGIIDILQDYDISKKLEHAYKSIHNDPTSISAVDPRQYSKRFRKFIFRVFIEDT